MVIRRVTALTTALCLAVFAVGAARADTESAKLAKYKPAVDRAVDKALRWFERNQRPNGSFPGEHGNTNAMPGLVGMAFLSKGYVPGREPHGETLNRCVDYVLSTPGTTGYIGVRGGRMYSQGIATLFLSEVSGMVDPGRQKKIDALLPKALRVVIDAQGRNGMGAWRYEPTSSDADISVTGWNLMALRSARLNGAPVPKAAIDRAIGFINSCRSRNLRLMDGARSYDDGGYWYHAPQYYSRRGYWLGGPSTPARTGAALLCRELSGYHDDAINQKAGDYILRHAKAPGFIRDGFHAYATYYCSQGMFQLGGARWEQFAEAMYQYLLGRQRSNGTWVSNRGETWQAYSTAMYTLALTVSYRQLPIYQR